MGPRRTLLLCVAITLLLHVVTYLLNTQLPLQILALGGRHAQIGWLFAATTGVAMILRPQVGGWTDRYGGRAVMLPGAGTRSWSRWRRSSSPPLRAASSR